MIKVISLCITGFYILFFRLLPIHSCELVIVVINALGSASRVTARSTYEVSTSIRRIFTELIFIFSIVTKSDSLMLTSLWPFCVLFEWEQKNKSDRNESCPFCLPYLIKWSSLKLNLGTSHLTANSGHNSTEGERLLITYKIIEARVRSCGNLRCIIMILIRS